MKKRVLALVLASVLSAGILTACGTKEATPEETVDTQEGSTEEATEEEVVETKVITVAATSVPHAEILAEAKNLLSEQGWDLQITEFADYVQPNEVVEGGDFDCNFFQHTPYLTSFNEEKGTHLVNVGEIHYEPLGLYPGTETDLANISEGAEIAVPNDTTNEARALLLLQDNGLITLAEDAGITATINDIVENPKNIKFVELEAAQIARVLPEVAFGILNGNYALQAGLNAATDALVTETSDSQAAKTYVNIVVVKEGNEENAGVKKLVEVLKSDEMKDWINETYLGSVVPFEG